MNRTSLTLIGAATALAALTSVAALTAPGDGQEGGAVSAERLPVERSTLVCPQPSPSELAETAYTAFTPRGKAARGGEGGAELLPAEEKDTGVPDEDTEGGGKQDKNEKDEKDGNDGKDGEGDGDKDRDKGDTDEDAGQQPDAVLSLKQPGTPVTATTSRSDAPALTGSADGPFAPGWTVQQTTQVNAGAGRGLHGAACSAPDTDFWFPGASTAEERQDYVHLTNPDDTAAVVDLELYGKEGAIPSETGEGLTVPPHSTVPVLLSTLTSDPVTNVTVHAVVRTGRVAAQVQAIDEKLGGDWLPPAAVPRSEAVLPGIPADATSVRLAVHAPGDQDADLDVRLATPSGKITPAGNETLHVRAGMTSAVDLEGLTQGEAGSLVLTPAQGGGTPVVAALRVTRGKGGKQETAFIPSTTPVQRQATAADNSDKGSTLSLSAPGKAAKVRVTASAGSGGGSPVSETYTVKAGTTRALDEPPRPRGGKGTYALTVERLSGGEVYAARTLEREEDGVPMFTVQALPDDRGVVAVPEAGQDLSVLTD